jgi:DNA-binding transcriptional MerR regulator
MTTQTETSEEVAFSTTDVLAATPGLTYRMLDYWLRQGAVVLISNAKTGSGGRRTFTAAEVDAIKRLYERYKAATDVLEHIRSGAAWMEEAVDDAAA